MRSVRETTTQTTCDCEDCPSFAITTHLTRSPNNAERHHQMCASDGWTDVEARDYCPGCPAEQDEADHDHTGAWADATA